ncbi:MAG: GNAT family N-acetyltransferase [Defluviitaleaceae bacterium]|nr:GNAT family N-acetyltransferase [Defluviitaleaceae bacterium]
MLMITGQKLKIAQGLFTEYNNNIPIFQSVLDGNYEGTGFVDDNTAPSWVVLQLPIGFHFVAGRLIEKKILEDILFNHILPVQDEKQLIVFSPSTEWQPLLESIFLPRKGFIVPRKMFKFSHEKYQEAIVRHSVMSDNAKIIITKERIEGNFCKNDTWVSRLLVDGECVSTCAAPMTGGGYAEIDVKTQSNFQGQGYATLVTLALIQNLLENALIPCWSAWPYRQASQSLAEKVGFIPEPDVNAWLWDENECS